MSTQAIPPRLSLLTNMKNQWSPAEDAAIVADYLAMLAAQSRGLPVNKSKTRRALLPLLNNRSEGSIEFKRCNVSAVLADLGMPHLKGYLPSAGANYQRSLVAVVQSQLASQTVQEVAA